MKYVYVAGPLSTGGYDPAVRNIRNTLLVGDELLEKKFVPFIPHLDHFWHFLSPKDYETWMAWDFAWIERCDVLLRLPGASAGGDREVEYAKKKGIPVVYSVRELEILAAQMFERRTGI